MPVSVATPIVLDKPRTLRYDFNGLRKAEMELTKLWGKRTTVPQLLGQMYTGDEAVSIFTDKLSVSEILILVWAGLLHEDNTITLDYVGSLLELGDMGEVLNKVMEAIGNSMTKDQPKNDQAPQAQMTQDS